MPDSTSDYIQETVGNVTGYKRAFFPNKLAKELKFLQFKKVSPDSVQYLYSYLLEPEDEKRIVCIITDLNSRIFFDNHEQEDFLYISKTNKVCYIKLYQNNEIPPIIIQSESKPEAFIGKVYMTNEEEIKKKE